MIEPMSRHEKALRIISRQFVRFYLDQYPEKTQDEAFEVWLSLVEKDEGDTE